MTVAAVVLVPRFGIAGAGAASAIGWLVASSSIVVRAARIADVPGGSWREPVAAGVG
jgi:hypothetical protein